MEKNMYQEAIADAKAVRASALANAKAAIQEAFEPKLKEMIKATLEESDSVEEKPMEEEMMGPYEAEDAGNLDETTLDEILAELEAGEEEGEGETETQEEAEELQEAKEEEGEEEETETETETEEEDESGEEATDDTKVVELTLGDLVDAIKAAMGSEKGMESAPEMGSDDDTISLDEILAELDETDGMEETAGTSDIYEAKKKKDKEDIGGHKGAALKAAKKETGYKEELEEANATIEEMRNALNETNLLNAKLLYVNKIFKSKTLSEAQKVKVLNSFDKATTVKETKTVYETLMEAMQAPKKTALKESIGFASKAAGANIVKKTLEADPFVTRMQKLAGII